MGYCSLDIREETMKVGTLMSGIIEEGAKVKVDKLFMRGHSNEASTTEEVQIEDIITTGKGTKEFKVKEVTPQASIEVNSNAGCKKDGHFLAEVEEPVGGVPIGVIITENSVMITKEVSVTPSPERTASMLPLTTATQAVKEEEGLTDIVARSLTRILHMSSSPQTSGGQVTGVREADLIGVGVDMYGEVPVPGTITINKRF